MSAVTFEQYLDDPDAAAEMIREQVHENLRQQGIPTTSKAGLVDMLTRFEIINLELSRLHHRLLDIEVNHATE